MSEICTPPILGTDENGDATIAFNDAHSWGDVVRWIAGNPVDLAEVQRIIKETITNLPPTEE